MLVFSAATPTSGCPAAWAAEAARPGINLIALDGRGFDFLRAGIAAVKQPGDLVVLSLHWGANFVRGTAREERAFGHRLIDEAGVDLVHGHSSHHVRGVEVHRGRLVIYGCGDLINDYEGIRMNEHELSLEPDLGLVWLARFDAAEQRLLGLEMVPTRMQRLQLHRAGKTAMHRLAKLLNREGEALGTRVAEAGAVLRLEWNES